MPSWFSPLLSNLPSFKSLLLLLFLALIDGASNVNTPNDQGSLGGQKKDMKDPFKGSLAEAIHPHKPDLAYPDNILRTLDSMPEWRSRVFGTPSPTTDFQLADYHYAPHCSDAAVSCQNISAHCLVCDITTTVPVKIPNCIYGELANYTCHTRGRDVRCQGETTFELKAPCRYCYQTEVSEHTCISTTNCHVAGPPYNQRFRTNCTVNHDVVCLGRRTFYKTDKCNFSTGYRWSTALLLSVTVGGFGGDRFYLGHWREGIGKLFSFGGLGVWTVVDIILIAVGYLRPDDGSLYIDL